MKNPERHGILSKSIEVGKIKPRNMERFKVLMNFSVGLDYEVGDKNNRKSPKNGHTVKKSVHYKIEGSGRNSSQTSVISFY